MCDCRLCNTLSVRVDIPIQTEIKPNRIAARFEIHIDCGVGDLVTVNIGTQNKVVHRPLFDPVLRHQSIQERFADEYTQIVIEQVFLQC